MGYTTEFEGHVTIEPPLNEHEVSFLKDLADTRRMNRTRGPLFVKGTDAYGQGHDPDIIEYNNSHPDQPGLWCQWVPVDDGTIEWDGSEKFYKAEEWMAYLALLLGEHGRSYVRDHLDEDDRLQYFTNDHVVNGVIDAQGEEAADRWRLVVQDNVVTRQSARIVWD